MKINIESAKILGIDTYEQIILNTLDEKNILLADISKLVKIPRTSLYYTLPRLLERGFIEKRKIGAKIYWRKKSNQEIRRQIQNSLDKIFDQNSENFTKIISKETSITFHYGAQNVATIFERLAKLPSRYRFSGIQPRASIIQAISKVPTSYIVNLNKKIKEKKLIVEGVVHEGDIEEIKKIMQSDDYKALLESVGGRSADYAKLPPDYMKNICSEIYLFDDQIALINWKEEFAIIIHNKDVFNLLLEMFKSTKYMLAKYDQNEKIARKLVELG
jgi:sugar-specific transcriptional regulator TrmB